MIRLLGVELTRLRWRRAVLVLLVAAVVVPAMVWAGLAWGTRPVSDSEYQAAVARAAQDRESGSYERDLRRCVKHPERYTESSDPADCEEEIGPQPEWYLSRAVLDLREHHRTTFVSMILVLAGLMMLIGTTFSGADWNSGSMSNQLLFEPRRLRVWWAKALAVCALALVATAAVGAAFWGGLLLLAMSRDITTPSAVLDNAIWIGGRGVLLAVAAALGAYALTMLFRSTVATLGVMFAVVVAGSLLIAALPIPDNERWMLPTNVAAFLLDGTTYYTDPPANCGFDGEGTDACSGMVTLGLWGAVRYLGVLLALALGLSQWSFWRRDIP